jgi:pyruvate/2-oxoglutarate dehydrogenase complex dihydrolipoamide dehydrogenase (E3) component
VANAEGLRLEEASVSSEPKSGGVENDHFCTANPNIFAAGDVCIELKFTNAAQASVQAATADALLNTNHRRSDPIIPLA